MVLHYRQILLINITEHYKKKRTNLHNGEKISAQAPASTQESFIRGSAALESKTLAFYIPFLTDKVPLSYTLY